MQEKFPRFTYRRPDLAALQEEWRFLLNNFSRATTAAAQQEIIEQINQRRQEFESGVACLFVILSIRSQYYATEQDF